MLSWQDVLQVWGGVLWGRMLSEGATLFGWEV